MFYIDSKNNYRFFFTQYTFTHYNYYKIIVNVSKNINILFIFNNYFLYFCLWSVLYKTDSRLPRVNIGQAYQTPMGWQLCTKSMFHLRSSCTNYKRYKSFLYLKITI